MHRAVIISNENRILNTVGIFANSNYLDLIYLQFAKIPTTFVCMKLTTKICAQPFISGRWWQLKITSRFDIEKI